MKKLILGLVIFSGILFSANAQTPIDGVLHDATNSQSKRPDAASEVYSKLGGFLVPRMTQAERNAIATNCSCTPTAGLLIYQTNSGPGFYFWDGSAWYLVASTPLLNGFILNGTSVQASSDFNISGTGTIGTTLTVGTDATIGNDLRVTGNDIFGQSTADINMNLNSRGGIRMILDNNTNGSEDFAVQSNNGALNVFTVTEGGNVSATGNGDFNGNLILSGDNRTISSGLSLDISTTSGMDLNIDSDNNSATSEFRVLKDVGTELFTVEENGVATVTSLGTGMVKSTAGALSLGVAGTDYLTGNQSISLTGPVTGTGTTSIATTITDNAVTNVKLADMATSTFKGRITAGTGDPEDLTVAQAKTLLNLTGTNSGDQTITLTGDVTGSGTGSFATTIANDAVTNAKLANMAANTVKVNATAGAADPTDIAIPTNNVLGRLAANIVAIPIGTTAGTIAAGDHTHVGLADNLGNHTATAALNMNSQVINNVATINFLAPTGDPSPVITSRTVPAGQGAATEKTELILFHSNDPANGSGNDQITLRAPALSFQTYNDATVGDIANNSGYNERMYITPAGNVGVGTTGPTNTLNVNNAGTTAATATTYPLGVQRAGVTDLTMGSDASYAYAQSWNSKPLLINSQGNDVGIGTAGAPGYKLNVNGSFRTAAGSLTLIADYLYVLGNTNCLNSGYNSNALADMWINYHGYLDGTTQFRNFNIGDGKQNNIAWFDGTNRRMSINNGQTATYTLDVNGGIRSMDYGGAGTVNIYIGDDAYLSDIDQSNIVGLYGNPTTAEAGLLLGSGGPTLYGKSTFLGVGTTNPGDDIHVRKATYRITAENSADADGIASASGTFSTMGQVRLTGFTTASGTLGVSNVMNSDFSFYGMTGTNDNSDALINWGDDNDLLFAFNGTEVARIKGSTGNMGIGMNNPGAKLEVAGQVKITGGAPGAGKVLTSDAVGLATWATVVAAGDNLGNHTATANLAMAGFNVNGVSAVNGNGDNIQFFNNKADDVTYEWLGYYSGGTRQGIILYDGAWTGANNVTNEFSITAEGSNMLTLNSTANHIIMTPRGGNVGIGTLAPTFKLHVPSGYIGTDYINTTDNAITTGVTGIMTKAGDNYYRTANAAAVRTFLGAGPSGMTVFTTGSGTYTVPAGVAKLIVRLVGGGGAGGSANYTGCPGLYHVGAGGGAGGYCEGILTSPAATYAYAVGAGGAANVTTCGANGGSGGNTTFGSFAGNGGTGGRNSVSGTAINGGAGGTASGGSVNLTGANGGLSSSNTYMVSGKGAATPFGDGGSSLPCFQGNAPGYAGVSKGSGGGGSNAYSSGWQAGGAGAAGIIIIYEFR